MRFCSSLTNLHSNSVNMAKWSKLVNLYIIYRRLYMIYLIFLRDDSKINQTFPIIKENYNLFLILQDILVISGSKFTDFLGNRKCCLQFSIRNQLGLLPHIV